jgi:hypothetical protein
MLILVYYMVGQALQRTKSATTKYGTELNGQWYDHIWYSENILNFLSHQSSLHCKNQIHLLNYYLEVGIWADNMFPKSYRIRTNWINIIKPSISSSYNLRHRWQASSCEGGAQCQSHPVHGPAKIQVKSKFHTFLRQTKKNLLPFWSEWTL